MDSIKFDALHMNEEISQVIWMDIQPLAALSKKAKVEFFVPGSGAQYIDLSQTELYDKCHIILGNGDDIPAIPVNLRSQCLMLQEWVQ